MARYYSDDGVFDAPVEKIWKLIQAHNTDMAHIHPDMTPVGVQMQPDGSAVAKIRTRGPDGRPMDHEWRFLVKPPFTQTVEMLKGPMAGSWMTTTYLPEGSKTRAITVAEWKVQGVSDEATLRKLANEFFDHGFDEDSKYLKTMK